MKNFQLEAIKDSFSNISQIEHQERLECALLEICDKKLGDNSINELYSFLFEGCEYISDGLKKEVDSIIFEKRAFCCKLDAIDLFELKITTRLPIDKILLTVQENANLSLREIKRKLRVMSKKGNANYFDVVPNSDIYFEDEDISEELTKVLFISFDDSISIKEFYKLYNDGKLSYVTSLSGVSTKISDSDIDFLYKCLRISSNRSKVWCLSMLFQLLHNYNTSDVLDIPCLYYSDEYGVDAENFILMTGNEYIDLIGSNAKGKNNKKNIINWSYYTSKKSGHTSNRVAYIDLQDNNMAVVPTFSCNLRLSYPHLKGLKLVRDINDNLRLVTCFEDYMSVTDLTKDKLIQQGVSTARQARSNENKPTIPLFSPEAYIKLKNN